MNKKRLLYPLGLCILGLAHIATHAKEEKESPHDDPVSTIQKRYKELYVNDERYQPPAALSNRDPKFRRLHDMEKEKRLLQWFVDREKRNLTLLTRRELTYRGIIVIAAMIAFALFLATAYISIVKIVLKNASLSGSSTGIERFVGKLYNWFSKIDLLSWMLESTAMNQSFAQDLGGDKAKNLTGIVTLYYAMTYLNIPIVWFGKQVTYLWALYQFMHDPYHDSKLTRAERMYIESIYLFDKQQRRLAERLFMAFYAGRITHAHEIETFIETLRLLPKGAKRMGYDHEAIREAFEGYPPHIVALAEDVIAMLVVYTGSILHGKQSLWRDIPIKPILLVGPPGTGKSNFIEKICEVTGLSPTHISLARAWDVEFKGKNGRKNILGLPGAYVDGLRKSKDRWGRNYQNNLIIFGDIGTYFDDDMAIQYFKMFLDPEVRSIEDDYVNIPIFKPPFIFATSSVLPKDPELLDRFMVIELDNIEKSNKKRIMEKLLHVWISFLADPALQTPYDEAFDEAQLRTYLRTRMKTFIDDKDDGVGMRESEEYMFRTSMFLVKQRVKGKAQSSQRQAVEATA